MSDFKIEEVKSQERVERVAIHSHIKGLGITPDGKVSSNNASGFVGQEKAREAASLLVDLIKTNKMAGRSILLTGPPCSGKTALALAVSRELGSRVPFCSVSGPEIYSAEIKKTEVLMEHFRRSIGVRVKERKEVYEGEVTEIKPVEVMAERGFGKTISHVMIGLKTVRGTKMLKLDPEVYEGLQRERVSVGDVIYIEGNSGNVKRVGRSDAFATEFDLEADEYVPVPKGEVHKQRNVVQDVTLHDLDIANAKPEGGSDVMSLMGKMLKPKKTEITEKLRTEVNKVISRFISEGVAEVIPGVLFIDEVHMLDIECFAFLNRALENSLAPIVIFATNRGNCVIRGTSMTSPHGIPLDLLDRTVAVKTVALEPSQMADVLRLRAKEENVEVSSGGLGILLQAAVGASLRYALQLLTPAKLLAESMGKKEITGSEISEVKELFWDCKRSAQRLMKEQDQFLV